MFLLHFRNLDRAIRPLDKLLLTLRFLATGDFYISVGDFAGVHKTTAGRVLKQVITALCTLFHQVVHLPETQEDQQTAKRDFFNISHFPRIIGAIDCTHIKIQSPGGNNAEIFRNRKGYFSINTQVVCSAKLKIIDLVCRWPGSTHDNHIFENSALKIRMQNGEMGNGVLLADRGYALRAYVITPLENPQTEAENVFNEAQIRTRNVIERVFGVWKRRFPILSLGIRCKIPFNQMIIVACAVLQNIAVDHNEENFEDENDGEEIGGNNIPEEMNHDMGAREPFIDYFRNLIN